MHIRGSLFILLVLVVGTVDSASAFGVMYSQRIGGGSTGGFIETFCTGFLETSSYSQPLQVFEANDSFERSGTMTNQGFVSLGSISMRNSGAFSNELVNVAYGGSVQSNIQCLGGSIPDITQWNDTMTVTGSGTFAFTVVLDSKVEGSPLRGTSAHGIADFSNVEARLHINGANPLIVLTDAMDDGDQLLQRRTLTANLILTAGDTLDLAGTLKITLLFGALEGSLAWDIDAGSTANFFIDPVSPGASYTMESGVNYMTPIPLPAAVWLFGTALGLLGCSKRNIH